MLEANWSRIEKVLADAVSIAWDGCHKIYILMDEDQHQDTVGYGYDPVFRVSAMGVEAALQTLKSWYDDSCGLRFVNSVRTIVDGDPNDGFVQLISQFAEEDEIEFCDNCDQEIDFCDCEL